MTGLAVVRSDHRLSRSCRLPARIGVRRFPADRRTPPPAAAPRPVDPISLAATRRLPWMKRKELTAATASCGEVISWDHPPAPRIFLIVCFWISLSLPFPGTFTSRPKNTPSTHPTRSGMPAAWKGPPCTLNQKLPGNSRSRAARIRRWMPLSRFLVIASVSLSYPQKVGSFAIPGRPFQLGYLSLLEATLEAAAKELVEAWRARYLDAHLPTPRNPGIVFRVSLASAHGCGILCPLKTKEDDK